MATSFLWIGRTLIGRTLIGRTLAVLVCVVGAGCSASHDFGADAADAPESDAFVPPTSDGGADSGRDGGLSASCADGPRSIAYDVNGIRAMGLAPLGEGWAVLLTNDLERGRLLRLDGVGGPIGDPIELGTGRSSPSGIGLRALGAGVVVRVGDALHFVDGDGIEAFPPLTGMAGLVMGPSTGDTVLGILGNDLVILRADPALSIERLPTGVDLAGFFEPDGSDRASNRSVGVSGDGCVVLADTGRPADGIFEARAPSVRTVPVLPGSHCPDLTRTPMGRLVFGGYETLSDGRFVAITGQAHVGSEYLAELLDLEGLAVIEGGTIVGPRLEGGVRGTAVSAADRVVVGLHGSGLFPATVSLWRTEMSGSATLVGSATASGLTGVYLAVDSRADRIAAVYADGWTPERGDQQIVLRCDL